MTHNSDRIVIRSYNEGDEYVINEMFNEVFNQNRELSAWYWKYRDNPYGNFIISLAESEDGTLAAHYAGYPVRVCNYHSNNSAPDEFTTYHLGDKMTRKQFRVLGFGKSSLLARTFAHFKQTHAKSIPFGYGFGTHHSLRFGLMFLNYADIELVTYRRLNLINMSGVDKTLGPDITINEVSAADETWTEFFNSTAVNYGFLIKRDAAYIKWRYLQRPDKKYLVLSVKNGLKLVGWAVFHRVADKLIWGDALFYPGCAGYVRYMLSHLKKHPISTGADFIEGWFPSRPVWWDAILKDIGFSIEAEPNKLHLTGPVFNDPDAPETLRKYFYYTMGDSDLF